MDEILRTSEEHEEFGEDYFDEEYVDDLHEEDPFYVCSCDTPGCIALPGHFRSECHTVQDAADWHSAATGEPVPWPLREPFYTFGLLWQRFKYRDNEVARQEWHFHWHCDVLPSLRPDWTRRVWPDKCLSCGHRWRACEDGCLPF